MSGAPPIYRVEAVSTIEGLGIALHGFTLGDYPLVESLTQVELKRPDGTLICARVVGVDYPPSVIFINRPSNPKYAIVVAPPVALEDVPIGTEVRAACEALPDSASES